MVHVIAKARYGGLNEYKANTFGFSRVFRAILTVLEQVADDNRCSPEGALALVSKHLDLKEFVPVDEPINVDMRHNEEELKAFLGRSLLGRKMYLLRVVETLLRLDTRDGFKALELFELARIEANRDLTIQVGYLPTIPAAQPTTIVQPAAPITPNNPHVTTSVDVVSEQSSEAKPKKKFKTKKSEKVYVEPKTSSKPISEVLVMSEPSKADAASKLDDMLKRGKDAVARSQETLAKSGQVVTTNPLLTDFI